MPCIPPSRRVDGDAVFPFNQTGYTSQVAAGKHGLTLYVLETA